MPLVGVYARCSSPTFAKNNDLFCCVEHLNNGRTSKVYNTVLLYCRTVRTVREFADFQKKNCLSEKCIKFVFY